MTVLIVTTEESGVDKYSQELAERLDIKQIISPRYMSLKEVFRLSKLIRNEPDIVHLPNQNFARFCFLRKKPYVVTVHDVIRFYLRFEPERTVERLLLRLDIWSIQRASHVIATSQHTKKDLVKYMRIPESKITVVYDGIDHDIFKLYEGFGLPPVEAMACGCPLVTSNVSSIPEVVGDAGILVDPYDVDSLTQAMKLVLTNSRLRDKMVRKGLEQVQ